MPSVSAVSLSCGPAGSVRGSDPTIRALFRYDGTGREIVTTLKYRGGRRLVGPLGRALASLVTEVDAEVVTWVPASRSGRRERGFDQGRLLARSVARASGRRARCLLAAWAGAASDRSAGVRVGTAGLDSTRVVRAGVR